jgi:hypothetical protein
MLSLYSAIAGNIALTISLTKLKGESKIKNSEHELLIPSSKIVAVSSLHIQRYTISAGVRKHRQAFIFGYFLHLEERAERYHDNSLEYLACRAQLAKKSSCEFSSQLHSIALIYVAYSLFTICICTQVNRNH